MGETEFALNDALAVQRWRKELAVEAEVQSYFKKFMGTGDQAIIKVLRDLEKGAGEKITAGLRMKLSGDGVEGDATIEGTSAEEALDFFNDSLFIDQRRKGTKTKGKMTEQRVPYNLRKEGKDALAVWFAEDMDQQAFIYLSGARGVNSDFHVGTSFTGRANNDLDSPDSDHVLYGGDATGKSDLASGDKMDLGVVERLVAKVETLDPMIRPVRINGENKYILLMHTYMAYDMRVSTSTNDWVDIQKNAGSRGGKNLLYQNSLGEYADVILHKHRNVIRFSDYGAGSDVAAGRALFLGAHAGIAAWGGAIKGSSRYSWHEETDDRGNKLVITAGSIYGVKKSRFNSKDFGVIAADVACADPNS